MISYADYSGPLTSASTAAILMAASQLLVRLFVGADEDQGVHAGSTAIPAIDVWARSPLQVRPDVGENAKITASK